MKKKIFNQLMWLIYVINYTSHKVNGYLEILKRLLWAEGTGLLSLESMGILVWYKRDQTYQYNI